MKYFFALAFLLLAGCSGPTSNSSNPPPPGWVANIQPGKFVGVWTQGKIADSCTCFVTEADTNFSASVVNGSTSEVLTMRGIYDDYPTVEWAEKPYFHAFYVLDTSNFYGDTDIAPHFFDYMNCVFSSNTDTLFYTTIRGVDTLLIISIRS
jgi:hypothetical protein